MIDATEPSPSVRCQECGAKTVEDLAHTHRAEYYRCRYCGHVWSEDRQLVGPQATDNRRQAPAGRQ